MVHSLSNERRYVADENANKEEITITITVTAR
jgi:hypothetical protein